MGALEKARNRSIDSLWEVNAKTIMALEATLGVAIGSDDGRVIYIQDTGVKEVGRGYIDRATKKVHICKERTEDVINTSTKFADHSIQSIYNKLENLCSSKDSKIEVSTDYGTMTIYTYTYGVVRFHIFTLTMSSINIGLTSLRLNVLEQSIKVNITDFSISIASSYNARIQWNTQYQNNTLRLNSEEIMPTNNALVIKGFSRLFFVQS